ncbi:MAG: hypothetical protein OH335_00005, partial [Candidatus Parvarchaeota archaeon]|nr:hypothetical protein [Candidatus Jingweiarchaeum tengchongense]
MMLSPETLMILLLNLIAMFVSLFLTPYVKTFLEESGIVGIDQHKKDKPTLATSAGIVLIAS